MPRDLGADTPFVTIETRGISVSTPPSQIWAGLKYTHGSAFTPGLIKMEVVMTFWMRKLTNIKH